MIYIRKFLFLSIAMMFFLVFAKNTHAQYNYGVFNYYTAGMKMGYDVYSYKMDDTRFVKHKVLPNYSFGPSGGWYYRYWIEFHADIFYANRDFTVEWQYPFDPSSLVPLSSDYKVAYISIPLQARANFIYTRHFKMNFGLGIMPEFRVRPPREIVTYQNGRVIESFDSYLVRDFRKALFGFPISIHTKYNFNRHYSTEFSVNYMWYVVRMNKIIMSGPGQGYYFNLAFYYDW